MVYGRIISLATENTCGTIAIITNGMEAIYRYSNGQSLPLKANDWVTGSYFGATFHVNGLAPRPCPLYIVDFVKKRYQVVHPDGQIVGWYETKKEKKSWFNFFRGL